MFSVEQLVYGGFIELTPKNSCVDENNEGVPSS